MVADTKRPHWLEAASSAFAVASALPVTMNAQQINELFNKVEAGHADFENFTAELSSLRNTNGESLLIVAARANNEAAVKQLSVDHNLIDEADNDGWTALLNASQQGHENIVRVLLEQGANVELSDPMNWTPLLWAVYKNHRNVVANLLNYKAHVNVIEEEDGLTPLIIASARGFHDIVELLLSHEAQVNACDKFGSTALIWAARKGHVDIIQSLLNAGAEVDAVGMYACTALMLAARGNFVNAVELLLTRDPNVNVLDQTGLSALGMAAREGYMEICDALISSGAFVNQSDRFGNWVLTNAVRSGNANIVRMLLEKFADVNCRDSENRTPLHIAIDKSFMDLVLILLERKPNLELKNKDGETALLRAVKSRHVALCQLLVNAGAKISATDNSGDNALHLALRARSKRLTQTLLANPSDSRLLYRPNKLGQTPYSIDQSNPQPILPLIFGPVDAEQQLDTMLGYDIYANVLADILAEPSLTLPLTMGLYAKWGSGKSVLLSKLKESMNAFSRNWLEGAQLRLSFLLLFYIFVVTAVITVSLSTALAVFRSTTLLIVIWSVGASAALLIAGSYCLLYYGSEVRQWYNSMRVGMALAKRLSQLRLVWNVLTLTAPIHSESDTASNPVSFLFADYHRLSSIGGEQALAKIVSTLFEAAESHFGVIAVRLFCSLRPAPPGMHGSLRRHCGLPVVALVAIALIFLLLFEAFMIKWLFSEGAFAENHIWFILSMSFLTMFVLLIIYPLFLLLRFGWTNMPRRRVNSAARNVHQLRFEGLMQKLQTEVDILADLIRSLDAFTRSQTRLVVVVDGLDNCEQERMVQTLDALELLFSARRHRPFITLIAVDPHIIVSAINHNMHSALTGTELTGHDYLKNMVHMPFYLHNSALKQLQKKLKEKRESLAEWKDRVRRQETFLGSHLSLRDADGRQSRKATMVMSSRNVGESLLSDDYFSNMNPRAMRRIVNALTLTGRLMRAFEIEFSWLSLGHWVSLIEQWPSRMCWLIDRSLDVPNNTLTLVDVYNQLKETIPSKDTLIELDRNPDNFEEFLDSPAIPVSDQLTVAHVKKFVPCSSNLDPYLRKLIRERRKGMTVAEECERLGKMALPPNAKHLFSDEKVWSCVDTPLAEMRVEMLCSLVKKLDLPFARVESIVGKFQQMNLNGLVLSSCTTQDLRDALALPLGDWTMIRLLTETLKSFGNNVPGQRIDKKRAFVLTEEDEDVEDEPEDVIESDYAGGREHRDTIIQNSAFNQNFTSTAEQKRRSIAHATEKLDSEHKWLMESLSGLDSLEAEGDIDNGTAVTSAAPSVRFDDEDDEDVLASDADSTESRAGSQENLLEPVVSPLSRHSSTSNGRAELMNGVHGVSIRSQGPECEQIPLMGRSSARSSATDVTDEHQRTVRRSNDVERERLGNLFMRRDSNN